MLTTIDTLGFEVKSVADRLFPNRTDGSMFLKLYEETGEVVRDPSDPGEVADVFILWLDYAKRKGIDIEAEVRRKLAVLENRGWELDSTTNVYHHTER